MANRLKKNKVKLDFLSDTDLLLMVEKDIRGGICHAIYQYAKANNKYMKNYVARKWFKGVEELPQFNEHFIKIYNEDA